MLTQAMVAEEGAQRRAQGGAPPAHAGSIVLVSAALASHGLPNYTAMSAAKAGVEGRCTEYVLGGTAVAAAASVPA